MSSLTRRHAHKHRQLLTEEEFRTARDTYGEGAFEADMGAESGPQAVGRHGPRHSFEDAAGRSARNFVEAKEKGLINRLKIVIIRDSDNKPEWNGCWT